MSTRPRPVLLPAPAGDLERPERVPGRGTHAARVDATDRGSVSFARTSDEGPKPVARAGSQRAGHEGHAVVAVGPGLPVTVLPGSRAGYLTVNGLPIHGAKIHRPPLRDDVLSRERLNGWLDIATSGRVALIVAEAGFGKTTLLADWSRHTRRRTIWYRLESDDRDWLTFVRHLVGSGQESDPAFAPETLRLLMELGPGGPTQGQIVDSLLRELGTAAATDPRGLTLIFDDYHLIDGSDETTPIVRSILEITGNGLSVIIATRTTPKLPLGRLRARGAVARLDGDDLCFDRPEADRLFRDAYRHPLEPDVLDDLLSRTEGWAALLGLVSTAIEDRSPTQVRAFVRLLSGAKGELYDYLAEEVIGNLPSDVQRFLMRVSILRGVDVARARVADPDDADDADTLLAQAERVGLLQRPDESTPHRFHPLVRDFLQARLEAEIGAGQVMAMHLSIGRHFEASDWTTSATHYRLAGDTASVARVIDGAIDTVLASGRFEDARPFLGVPPDSSERPVALVLRSRIEMGRGDLEQSEALARRAVDAAVQTSTYRGVSLLNLASVLTVAGIRDEAVELALAALEHALTPSQRDVAEAMVALRDASRRGDLMVVARFLARLMERQTLADLGHYAAVTRLNLAAVLYWGGDVASSLEFATDAELMLAGTSNEAEAVAAAATRAQALAHLGRTHEAVQLLNDAAMTGAHASRYEALLEVAQVLARFGDLPSARAAFVAAGPAEEDANPYRCLWAIVGCELALREADLRQAREFVQILTASPFGDVAGELRVLVMRARIAILANQSDAVQEAAAVIEHATAQRSPIGRHLGRLLQSIAEPGRLIGPEVARLNASELAVLSFIAEELTINLGRLTVEALTRVAGEAAARPERWRTALRLAIKRDRQLPRQAMELLAEVGDSSDLELLRSIGSSAKTARPHARRLARRIAPRVLVKDLGPVSLEIGGRQLGKPLRRKVAALLCFLTSRTAMAATRDEVLDALWPDLGPDTAVNSLNQTIYFMRRVFEPDFRDAFSPGYVRFDGETLSLDPELVDSVSRRIWALLTGHRRPDPLATDQVVGQYVGKYALDFAYEDWAAPYRDTLHAAVLADVEGAANQALATRDYSRAIFLTRRMLAVDPDADEIELTLLRAYRSSGHAAAAAEQYEHYASVQRDQLGIEPPPMEEL